MTLQQLSLDLIEGLAGLKFGSPITHVYNPLVYARASHDLYLEQFGKKKGRTILLGMNPGPWGMAQTGIPFGEIAAVRNFLKIVAPVEKPHKEHPKRPVEGFNCSRSEVSGRRVWTWAEERYGSAESFFDRFYIANFCPLSFMEESGRNRTPDKLPKNEQKALFDICDTHLRGLVKVLEPKKVIGIGAFAENRAKVALKQWGGPIHRILHPSPASPAANRGWAAQVESQLRELDVLD